MQYCGIAVVGAVAWLIHVFLSVVRGRTRSWAFWTWAVGLPLAAVAALVVGQLVSPPPPAVIHLYTRRPSDPWFYNAAAALVVWFLLAIPEPFVLLVSWLARLFRDRTARGEPTGRMPQAVDAPR